jgi:hypothetical protein
MAHAPKTTKSVLERRRAAIDRTRGVLARLAPGRSLVNELIAERHSQARAEEQAEAIRHPVAKH